MRKEMLYWIILLDTDVLDGFRPLDFLDLWKMDVQDAFLHAGLDLFRVDIVRQQQGLLEFLV